MRVSATTYGSGQNNLWPRGAKSLGKQECTRPKRGLLRPRGRRGASIPVRDASGALAERPQRAVGARGERPKSAQGKRRSERSERLPQLGKNEAASGSVRGDSVAAARGGSAPPPGGRGQGGRGEAMSARERANTHGKQECTAAAGGRRAAADLRRRHKLKPRGRPRPLDAAKG